MREKILHSSAVTEEIPLQGRGVHNRIKVLDGFRGLAVLLVTCYHFLPSFSFGWIGVDLFFVLSGFLITGKLKESVHSKNYFSVFYLRRVLRIVPLYYLVLILVFILFSLLPARDLPASYYELRALQGYYWLFAINLYNAAAGWTPNIMLVHFWSLACEMQFYLLWPFVVLLFRGSKTGLVFLLCFFVVFALGFRMANLQLQPLYRYVMMPSRIDAFSAGGLLYILFSEGRADGWRKVCYAVLVVSLLIAAGIMLFKPTPWHFNVAAVSTYGLSLNALFWVAVLGLSLSSRRTMLQTIFSGRIMSLLGRYSYGIYVFHLPVFIFVSKKLMHQNQTAGLHLSALIAFGLTIIVSVASYHCYEIFFLRLKPVGTNGKA